MLSKLESDLISSLLSSSEIDENKYLEELKQLYNDGFIEHNVTGSDACHIFYHGYNVTPKGNRAYEEYIDFQNQKKRDSEAIEIAKEANNLSNQANGLSNEANNISKKSNRLSIGAIVTSVVAVLVAIADIIFNICA